MTTECPSLTTLTPDTQVLTLDNIYELQVTNWNRTAGSIVEVKCQPGLMLKGQSKLTCLATGEWDLSPLPKCVDIPPSTTPAPGVDASLVLMIVLISVMVIVTVVMALICLALYQTHWRKKKEKFYGDAYHTSNSNDTSSQPYSISDRTRGDIHMHTFNVYQNQSSSQNRQNQTMQVTDANRVTDENFTMRDRRYPLPPYYKPYRHHQEYNVTYIPLDLEKEATTEVNDDQPESRRPPIPVHQRDPKQLEDRLNQNLRHQSAQAHRDNIRPFSDVTAYYRGLFYDGTSDAVDEFGKRKNIKRDYFLWRDMPSTFNSLRLPRPHYRP